MEFWRIYRVVRQRRILILAVALAALVAALVAGRPKVSDYSANATLAIPASEQFFFVSGGDAAGAQAAPSSDAQANFATDLIRGREVANRVIQQLGLTILPDELETRFAVARDPAVNQIRLTVEGVSPGAAVVLANAIADQAATFDQETQRNDATLAREFVEKQAGDISDQLKSAEDALLAFQEKNGAALVSGSGAQATNLTAEGQQVDFDLQAATARLASISSQMTGQQSTRTDRFLFENPIAQQLQAQLVQLQVSLTSQLAVHTEAYPGVVQTEALIKGIKDKLNSEVSKIVTDQQVVHNPIYDALTQERVSATTDLLALQAKKDAIAQAVASQVQTLPAAAQTQLEQNRLSRAVQILGQQAGTLETRLATARLREQEVQSLGSLTVIDHARTAQESTFAGLRFKLMLGLVLGLLGGLGLAFFLEYLDNTIRTPEAAERLLGVPALVAVPRHNPPFDEAYRMLRINLASHERGDDGADAILLTAPRPRSGTSTVVANLAKAFAAAGRRTTIVDAAFARPAQHRLFDVPNERGLGQVLLGEASIDDVRVPAGRNLWVVPAGPEPSPEMGTLLGAQVMRDALASLRRSGDIVLIDTAPVGAFADALDLAPLTSGVVLVLDSTQVPRGVEEQIKLQFDRLRVDVIGAVLTKVAPARVDSYYYQERFYREVPRRRRMIRVPASAAVVVMVAAASLAAGLVNGWRGDQEAAASLAQRTNVETAVRALEQTAGVLIRGGSQR